MSAEKMDWGGAEQPAGGEAELSYEVQEVLNCLKDEFEKEFYEPPGDDPYMAGHAYAWYLELNTPGSLGYKMAAAVIQERLELGRNVHPASSLAILFRSAFQKQAVYGYRDYAQFQRRKLSNGDKEPKGPSGYGNYPFSYRDEEHKPLRLQELSKIDIARDCLSALRFMLNDDKSATRGRDTFFHDTAYLNVQTNKTERYAPLRALMTLAYDRLQRPVRVIDYGCSGNHGLKSIALQLPQSVREVVQYVDATSPTPGYTLRSEKRDLTARLNHLIGREKSPVLLGPSVGVDLWSPYDDGMNHWRKSCTFRGKEWLNREKEDEYDYLEQKELPNVGFVQADLAHGTPPELEGQKFDFGFMSFMLDQMSDVERDNLLENAMKQCRWLVILDAVKLQADGSLEFVENFYDKSDPFPVNVIAIDTHSPNPQPETIMQFTDGRCQRARLFKNNVFDRL